METWKKLCCERDSLEHDESEKIRLLGILDFQIQEIEEAKLTKGEDEKLEADIRTASHAEHITEGLQTAMALWTGVNVVRE